MRGKMDFILLTQNSTPIFKYVVAILGFIMRIIFEFLNLIGIPNIGLSIILFTIVIYLLLLPLTIKQQKFSKLSARMNPELNAIRDKYKGKQDQESMLAMNNETKQVYAKYGVSPSGSCVQLLIQMPILLALYRVINSMPAYVTRIKDVIGVLADKIMTFSDGVEYVQNSQAAAYFRKNFEIAGNTRNAVIDTINKMSTTELSNLSDKFGLADLTYNGNVILTSYLADGTQQIGLIDTYNNFLGLNMGNSPMATIQIAFAAGNYLLLAGAIAIPVLSAITQWINYKLIPQPASEDNNKKKQQPSSDMAESMQQSMKMMNTVMPIMSAWFCLTLPAGMGLYWVVGAVVRSIQQVVINRHIDKMDIDAEIAKNTAKYNEKLKKQGIDPAKLNAAARTNTKSISAKAAARPTKTDEERAEEIRKSTEYYNQNAKPGSLAAKANMVRQYNERNNK